MPSPKSSQRTAQALQRVAGLFESKGWKAQASEPGSTGPDLVVWWRGKRYGVVLKATSEGRADRVIPLLSQVVLEARAYALQSRESIPLAVVHVDHAPRALIANVMAFAQQFAAEVAVGFVSAEGASAFLGEGLEGLNVSAPFMPRQFKGTLIHTDNLFSDLNQWMLKVLLAPELPEGMLNAPRGQYRNGVELARAAQVSAMTASRFLQQLRRERFLLEFQEFLTLVQREELFERWSAVAPYGTADVPARFLANIQIEDRVRELLNNVEGDACLGLFAAADAGRWEDQDRNASILAFRASANSGVIFNACMNVGLWPPGAGHRFKAPPSGAFLAPWGRGPAQTREANRLALAGSLPRPSGKVPSQRLSTLAPTVRCLRACSRVGSAIRPGRRVQSAKGPHVLRRRRLHAPTLLPYPRKNPEGPVPLGRCDSRPSRYCLPQSRAASTGEGTSSDAVVGCARGFASEPRTLGLLLQAARRAL